ncbi:MAG: double-strand break repair helicase AddA [Phreatobacter sp.]|uniref:double-strand break repair helicase AddA n=1 Tax=Phreatobacter sp. TaxID=1966341 RepID=UPI00273538E8|nr:double-strand break repair helicase AddA [Phreatobacter sp.]MDP2801403.1 double-strand break repair helicase AddA [Phreatobacter sp.]
MSRSLAAPPEAVIAQRKASDPAHSAWVSANAGSGKTYVLARRVVRLMLAGTPPGAILCLTFTKAAAATMANRVFELLGQWALLDDPALREALHALDGQDHDDATLRRARRLFAEALETPGGLKVQTIHAFCERVLHQFPFEANVASQFTVLDERAHEEMVRRAKLGVLLEAAAEPDGETGRALAHLSTVAADTTVDDLLGEALAARHAMEQDIAARGGLARAIATLGDTFGLLPGETEAALTAAIVDEAELPPGEWEGVADTLIHNSDAVTDKAVAAALRQAARDATRRSDIYEQIYFTLAGEPRKTIVTAKMKSREPKLAELFGREKDRLEALRLKRKAAVLRDGTAALLTLAQAISQRVEADKAARGALDFADLIVRTRDLFRNGSAPWILYKLDQGIDHVLVDEAQDTSPDQWEIVSALIEEFTAGEGARGMPRTLFVVGDEKQSIYSFQGAVPQNFSTLRDAFARRFAAAKRPFERNISLNFSFRSTKAVLSAVDRVFADDDARKGLSFAPGPLSPHEAARQAAPGLVELWPAALPEAGEDPSPWTAPVDAPGLGDPAERLAARIACHVRLWLDEGHRLPDRDRPIRAGDILVLVRRRGPIFESIIRALKNAGVPVAGADRLVLGEHIAVMDLLALGDCLLTPEDDLSLAAVLKSPLIGISEDDLLELAAGRSGSLWNALVEDEHPAAARLAGWRDEALALSPAAFYGRVLARDRGRRAMLARLGSEAADALDEFMSMALSFETTDIPTLRGFLSSMRASELNVKRDMELGRDEVRVMTVHGAKGLEADIVFLADTMGKPGGSHDPKIFAIQPPNAPVGSPPRLVWSPSSKTDVGLVAEARKASREAQAEEYRRLLYVAMTRAADRLIVCGARPKRAVSDVWYDIVDRTIGSEAVEEPADDGDGTVKRWRKGPPLPAERAPAARSAPAAVPVPHWLQTAAPAVAPPPRTLTPSGFGGTPGRRTSGEALKSREAAIRRGTIIHRLLQSLPDLPPDRQAEAAQRFLAAQSDIDAVVAAGLAAEALRLMADPRVAPLFGPRSRAEVPVAGQLGGKTVSGQIDRLVVTPLSVIIADFKTNDPAPTRPEDVPESYVAQLAIYRALLAEILPGRRVEAWLVWTAVPAVMPVAAERLDAMMAKLGLA